ncbi:MAG: cell division protein ZapA [Bacteroidales bacterium]|jgi:cell division protein ZapA (FtsZ GTPase activity inhibitor)|nr:cell division protein ZapA [Bacteroidales bacterium]
MSSEIIKAVAKIFGENYHFDIRSEYEEYFRKAVKTINEQIPDIRKQGILLKEDGKIYNDYDYLVLYAVMSIADAFKEQDENKKRNEQIESIIKHENFIIEDLIENL